MAVDVLMKNQNALLHALWRRFSRHGIESTQSGSEKRQRFLLNLFWLVAFVAYQFYFLVVINLVNYNRLYLYTSAIALLSAFAAIQWLVARRRHWLAKVTLLLVINAGIFFYDLFLGRHAGVHLYYIPFLFVAIYLFNYKLEKIELTIFSLMPIGLYALTESWLHNFFPGLSPDVPEAEILYAVNFSLSMVLVGVYNHLSARIHYDTETYLDQSKINLQTLIDNTQGSIWSIDHNYRIIAANKVYRFDMKNIFGIDVQSGYAMKNLINSPGYPKQWMQQYTRVFSGETFVEEYTFADEMYELQATPIYNTDKVVVGAAFYARDITVRKKK